MQRSVPRGVDIQGRPKISVGLALDNLREVIEELAGLELEYQTRRKELLGERDEMILDALDHKVAISSLQHNHLPLPQPLV